MNRITNYADQLDQCNQQQLEEILRKSVAFSEKLKEELKRRETLRQFEIYEPEYGETYYYFDYLSDEIIETEMEQNPCLKPIKKRRTKDEAKKDKVLWHITKQILDGIAELNRRHDWVCDWSDANQKKYYFRVQRHEAVVTQALSSQKQPTSHYMCENTLSDIREIFSDKELKAFVTQEWVREG